MSIQYNQAVADIQAVSNFHKYPSGVNKHNQSVKILSPDEFVAKYPNVFDDKTDPSKLPKTTEGLTATLMAKLAGASSAIKTTKLASNNLFQEKSLEDVFDIEKYSTIVTEENDDGKEFNATYYLQDEKKLHSFIKDIVSFAKQSFDTSIAIKEEELREEFSTQLNIAVAELTAQSSNQIEEAITSFKLEAPSMVKQTNLNSLVGQTFNQYGVQILEHNNSDNQVHKYMSSLPEANVFYDEWLKRVEDKFGNYLKADSNRVFNKDLVAQYTANVLNDMLADQGITNVQLPMFSSTPLPVNVIPKQTVNNTTSIEGGYSTPEQINPFIPPRQALENNNPTPNLSSSPADVKNLLLSAVTGRTN